MNMSNEGNNMQMNVATLRDSAILRAALEIVTANKRNLSLTWSGRQRRLPPNAREGSYIIGGRVKT